MGKKRRFRQRKEEKEDMDLNLGINKNIEAWAFVYINQSARLDQIKRGLLRRGEREEEVGGGERGIEERG